MSNLEKGKLHEVVSKLLTQKLQGLLLAPDGSRQILNRATCLQVYETIFYAIVELVQEAKAPLTNAAVNYLSQQYYDAVVVNGNQELDPFIFTQRAKTDDMDTKELALLATMLSGTDFAIPLIAAIKKRQ